MTIQHRSGKAHGNADGLSRIPATEPDCTVITMMLGRMSVSCHVVDASPVREPMNNGLGLKRTLMT